MSEKRKDTEPQEITSFNEELVSFDMNDLEVEELERRFELAIGAIIDASTCAILTCGDVTCGDLSCGVFKIKA